MCGIVAAACRRDVIPILIAGLKALEYRGYDSAGIAVLEGGERLERMRAVGKVRELEQLYAQSPISGATGIAHTRWATHGVPNTVNAHPHVSDDRVAVVHNGIIENHAELREELKAHGYRFDSDTDTEVIAHLVHQAMDEGDNLLRAVIRTTQRLHGAYAIAVMSRDEAGHVVGARRGSPLVAGIGEGEHFLGSDVQALIKETSHFTYLEEGDVAEITPDGLRIYTADGTPVERPVRKSELTADAVELTITRNGHSLTQDLVLPEGESQVFIRSYSPPLVITGAVLMGLSATALIAGAVLIAIAPYMFATWLLMLITPGVVLGIPGVVMTAVGANRPTTKLVTGAFTLGAVPR